MVYKHTCRSYKQVTFQIVIHLQPSVVVKRYAVCCTGNTLHVPSTSHPRLSTSCHVLSTSLIIRPTTSLYVPTTSPPRPHHVSSTSPSRPLHVLTMSPPRPTTFPPLHHHILSTSPLRPLHVPSIILCYDELQTTCRHCGPLSS